MRPFYRSIASYIKVDVYAIESGMALDVYAVSERETPVLLNDLLVHASYKMQRTKTSRILMLRIKPVAKLKSSCEKPAIRYQTYLQGTIFCRLLSLCWTHSHLGIPVPQPVQTPLIPHTRWRQQTSATTENLVSNHAIGYRGNYISAMYHVRWL